MKMLNFGRALIVRDKLVGRARAVKRINIVAAIARFKFFATFISIGMEDTFIIKYIGMKSQKISTLETEWQCTN